jgi:hypothetical protein
MKELDLLKKDWNKQATNFKQLSFEDIYTIIHKKSSSIVKWILIICIAEFIFWGALNLLIPDSFFGIYEKLNIQYILKYSYILHYLAILVFMYLFYKNYRLISVTDTTKLLMKNIIKTRKTVNYYVYYNIIMTVILSVIVNIIMFSNPTLLNEVMNPDHHIINEDKFFYIILISQIIGVLIMVGFLWGYYKIIYGILLRKLNKNFKELENLEF